MHGFDSDYFVQVAGLTQLIGEFMLVKPLVIDLDGEPSSRHW